MAEQLPTLPGWIEDRLELNRDYEVQDRHIVAVFDDSEEAYLSVSQVASRIDMSTQGTRNRLEHLAELGVLDSRPGANGRIYWIRDDRSAWPIPPDVEVEPAQEGVTVDELLSRTHVKTATAAVAVGLVAMALFLGGMVLNMALGPNPYAEPLWISGLMASMAMLGLGAVGIGLWLVRDD